MSINTVFQKKDCEINTEPCVIEKTVELTEKEYNHFYHNLLEDYSFIAENSDCMYQDNNGVRHCILVLGKGITDGILVEAEGYGYARYSAFLPGARLLIEHEQYPSLTAHADEMRRLTEKYVQKALDGQIDCQYNINFSEARKLCRQSGFTDELFVEMLSERQEFEYVEQTDYGCYVTIAEPYLRQEDERNLKKLTSKEVEVMCAKHTLWLNDAGGEQADFSNCLLKDLDLSRKNLNSAVFVGAEFTNTRLCGAELCFAVLNDAKFYNCDLSDAVAEEAEFKGVNCIGSNFSRGIFTHSNFAGAKFCECEMSCVNMQSCCIDETEFGDLNLTSVNLSDCSYDEQEWTEEILFKIMSM